MTTIYINLYCNTLFHTIIPEIHDNNKQSIYWGLMRILSIIYAKALSINQNI